MLLFKWLCPIPGLQSRIQRRREDAHLSGPVRRVIGVNNLVKVGNSSHVAFSSNWAGAAFESRTPYPPWSLTRPRHRGECTTLATAALHQIVHHLMHEEGVICIWIQLTSGLDDVSTRSTHPFNTIPPLRRRTLFHHFVYSFNTLRRVRASTASPPDPCSAHKSRLQKVLLRLGTPTICARHYIRARARHRQCSIAALP
jgi:hypothetical protein